MSSSTVEKCFDSMIASSPTIWPGLLGACLELKDPAAREPHAAVDTAPWSLRALPPPSVPLETAGALPFPIALFASATAAATATLEYADRGVSSGTSTPASPPPPAAFPPPTASLAASTAAWVIWAVPSRASRKTDSRAWGSCQGSCVSVSTRSGCRVICLIVALLTPRGKEAPAPHVWLQSCAGV